MSVQPPAECPSDAPTAPDALSITELYHRVDQALRSSFPREIWVTGEIRSLKVLAKGHCFIDLVDPTDAQDSGAPTLNVKCWSTRWRSVRSTLERLGIVLDSGMVVRAWGEVRFYKARGTVDFILTDLDTDALLGRVAAERAGLVRALVDEGLFDRNRGRPMPGLPLRIGLVASPGTEGYRDFLGQLEASRMAFDVRVVPTQVQGREAALSVASALALDTVQACDLVVVVRGGGSKSDLATFDSEPVARAIAVSVPPIWTGIGHTGDLSVADEVAHRSFITPTECGHALARIATDCWDRTVEAARLTARLARDGLEGSERSLVRQRHGLVTSSKSVLGRHDERLVLRTRTLRTVARGQLDAREDQLAVTGRALARSAVRAVDGADRALVLRTAPLTVLPGRLVDAELGRLDQCRRLLDAYDYRRQLERGYSLTRDHEGRVVRSSKALALGDLLSTLLVDGDILSEVRAIDHPGDSTNQREDQSELRPEEGIQ